MFLNLEHTYTLLICVFNGACAQYLKTQIVNIYHFFHVELSSISRYFNNGYFS